jgi:hypothetical protein
MDLPSGIRKMHTLRKLPTMAPTTTDKTITKYHVTDVKILIPHQKENESNTFNQTAGLFYFSISTLSGGKRDLELVYYVFRMQRNERVHTFSVKQVT